MTPSAGNLEFFGSDGPVTLAFAGADVGTVALRALREASGAVACGILVFAVEGGELLLSSPRWFDATFDLTKVDDDTVAIANADVAATQTRAAGDGPVPPCTAAATAFAATLPFVASNRGNLSAHGGTQYQNVDDDPGTVVGYDVATDTLGTDRAVTTTNAGGLHRWVVGARNASRFYGHCSCGGSTTLSAIDLDLVLASLDTDVDAAVSFSIDHGEYADGTLLVGDRTRDGSNANHLADVDPDTRAVSNERDVLGDLVLIDVALDDGAPIEGIAAATGATTSTRALTDGVDFGSPEPYLFAAASDDRFYGTCRCGRSDRFTHFDLATDTALDQIETEATGTHLSIRFGYVDATAAALVVGERLLALLGERDRFGDVVAVGADGRATEIYALQDAFEGFARGIAGVGDVPYVVTVDSATDRVLLYVVELD